MYLNKRLFYAMFLFLFTYLCFVLDQTQIARDYSWFSSQELFGSRVNGGDYTNWLKWSKDLFYHQQFQIGDHGHLMKRWRLPSSQATLRFVQGSLQRGNGNSLKQYVWSDVLLDGLVRCLKQFGQLPYAAPAVYNWILHYATKSGTYSRSGNHMHKAEYN